MKGRLLLWAVCLLVSVSLVSACAGGDDTSPGNNGAESCEDRDQDGYLGLTGQCQKGTDCDDGDSTIHPGADEVCDDGRDNDCRGGDERCNTDCDDSDGDRYGDGPGCLGPDCDDNDADVNPRAQEVCDSGKDEDCDGTDNACPSDCTDDDGDGFGVAGSNSDCPKQGDDCDDSDDTVHPDAEEVCNGADDNCDGTRDECEQAQASCSGTTPQDRCVVAVGGTCSSDGDCAENARCDTDTSECRYVEGESCSGEGECLSGFNCDGGACSGDFCAVTDCSGERAHCDSDAQRCVECRHWDEASGFGSDDCPTGETCTLEGWCGVSVRITDSDPVPDQEPLTNDIYQMSLALADCWIDKIDGSSNDMCAVLYVSSAVDGAITESSTHSAFSDGHLDFLGVDRYEALDDLWGAGWTNAKNIDWAADPQPDTAYEYCLWFDTTAVDELFVGKCADFAP